MKRQAETLQQMEARLRAWPRDAAGRRCVWPLLVASGLPELEREARERQAHGQTAPGKTLVEIFPQASDEGKARDHAAAGHTEGLPADGTREL